MKTITDIMLAKRLQVESKELAPNTKEAIKEEKREDEIEVLNDEIEQTIRDFNPDSAEWLRMKELQKRLVILEQGFQRKTPKKRKYVPK